MVVRKQSKVADFVFHDDALIGHINLKSPGEALTREQGT